MKISYYFTTQVQNNMFVYMFHRDCDFEYVIDKNIPYVMYTFSKTMSFS